MPISLQLDKHLNNFGHYLLEGYLLFPTVPRNVGSITSVNENEHFNKKNVGSVMSVNEYEHFRDRLTI